MEKQFRLTAFGTFAKFDFSKNDNQLSLDDIGQKLIGNF